MNLPWQAILWQQFGAAIDMLDDALCACPNELWCTPLWDDPTDRPEYAQFWYRVYHTLFWLDLYLTGTAEGFQPPAPFSLVERDQDNLPTRPFTKAELQTYLVACRQKCQATLAALNEETAQRFCRFDWVAVSFVELQLYSMRHVQEHAAQLSMLLGQHRVDPLPDWIPTARSEVARPVMHAAQGVRDGEES